MISEKLLPERWGMRLSVTSFLLFVGLVFLIPSASFATTCPNANVILPATIPIVNQPLICGATNDLNATSVPAACGSASNSYKGGNESLYKITPSASGVYNISIAGQSWTSIFVYAGCPIGGTCVNSVGTGATAKSLSVSLTAGTEYFIWFDTWPTPNSPCPGTFSMSFTPPPPPPPTPAICTSAPALLPASLPIVNQAIACNAANDLNSTNVPTSCGGATNDYKGGNEALYKFTPTSTGVYNVSISGQTWTSIFVYTGCPVGGTCVGSIGNSSSSKSLQVTLTAGTEYSIWFDTWPTPNSPCPGTFSLSQQICGTVSSLGSNTITASTANLTWNFSGTADNFTVEYGPTGFTQGTGTIVNSPSSPLALSMLSANTTYQFYVKANCAAGSTLAAGPVSFTTLALPPVNDNCADAIDITCGSGVVAGTTLGSTVDVGYTNCGAGGNNTTERGVWYRIQGNNSSVTINTCNSVGYDSRITVYEGSCGTLTCVAGNDDNACTFSGLRSEVQFNAFFGTDYYVFVHGYQLGTGLSAVGNFELNINCTALCLPIPGNNDCLSSQPLAVEAPGSSTYTAGFNSCASTAATAPSCAASQFGTYADVWYSFVATGSTNRLRVNYGTAVDLRASIRESSCVGTQVACISTIPSGQFINVTGLTQGSTYYVQLFSTVANSGTYDIQISDQVICSLTVSGVITPVSAPAATDGGVVTTVNNGTSPYTYIWSNSTSNADLSNVGVGTYTVTVQDAFGCQANQSFTLTPPPPANDDCSNAILISCANTTVSGTTINSTVDANFIDCGTTGTNLTERGVWYKIPGSNNEITITTCDPAVGFDSRLTVYSGSCGTFTCVTSNDDMTPSCNFGLFRSEVTFNAFAGTDYYVFVHGYQFGSGLSETGNFNLNISCGPLCIPIPANDEELTPQPLTVLPFGSTNLTPGFNSCATTALVAPSCVSQFGTYSDVFYSYVANVDSMVLQLNPISATNLGVTLKNANTQVSVGCLSGFTTNSTITINGLTIGDTYIIQVFSEVGSSGTFEIGVTEQRLCSLTVSAVETNVSCNGANDGSVVTTVQNGNGAILYNWNGGFTTPDRLNVGPGTYTVVVLDDNGCTATTSKTISQPSALSASANATTANCILATDANVTLNIAGGVLPYQYLWSNGATTQNLMGVGVGSYSVTITDDNGCVTTASVSVGFVNQPCTDRTRYVAVNGNNSMNDCLLPGNPCQTIQYAVDVANTNDTIQVAAGLYTLASPVSVPIGLYFRGAKAGINAINRTSSSAQFAAESMIRSTGTILNFGNLVSNITVDGFVFEPTNNSNSSILINLLRNTNVTIKNNMIGSTNTARIHNGNFVSSLNSSNLVYENNWILSLTSGKVAFNISGGSNTVIQNNRHRVFATGHFMYAQGSENITINNNIVDRIQTAIRLGGSNTNPATAVNGVVVSNNTLVGTNQTLIVNNSASQNIVVVNNNITSPSTGVAAIRINNSIANVSGTRFNQNRIFTSATDPSKDYIDYVGNQLDFSCNYWGKGTYPQFEQFIDNSVLSNSINVFPFIIAGTSMGGMGSGFYPPSANCSGANPSARETGVEILNTVPVISLFPNPADRYTMLNLNLPKGDYRIIVQDLSGKILLDKIITQLDSETTTVENLSLDQLASGMYLVHISGDQVQETKKLVVQH